MQPTCLTCGRPVEDGRTCCHTCLAKLCSDSICLDADAAIKAFDSAMPKPDPPRRCPNCGDPIPAGRALCDFCLAKSSQPQSYPPSIVPSATGTPRPESMQFLTRAEHDETIGKRPKPPSIVPAAVDEMKSAIMDSMMLTLTNIVEQADALIVQLARLKGAIK